MEATVFNSAKSAAMANHVFCIFKKCIHNIKRKKIWKKDAIKSPYHLSEIKLVYHAPVTLEPNSAHCSDYKCLSPKLINSVSSKLSYLKIATATEKTWLAAQCLCCYLQSPPLPFGKY